MADGKVLFEVVATSKGFKVVANEIEGLTTSINKASAAQEKNTRTKKSATGATKDLNKAGDHFNRGQKGVAGATANSTKSFSKMRDAIGGGSSGLVGAYATLAANVFAATAVFQALNRSAKLEQLTKTMEMMGAQTGQNLIGLAKRLREITNEAISTQEALAAASFGTSAGFSTEQLEGLARVAKGASAALGRDLGDAFDRLTRGAAKLEPEILDELGIMVKLLPATQEYARSVGKTVAQLSQYERSQAFVNEINKQGAQKYGAIADAVEALPLERLLASLENVSKAAINFATNFIKLPDFLNYLADSTTALTGAMVLFASTIAKQALPMVYAFPAALAKMGQPKIDRILAETGGQLDTLSQKVGHIGPKARKSIGELADAYKDGSVSTEHFAKANTSLITHTKKYEGVINQATIRSRQHEVALKSLNSARAGDAAVIAYRNKQLAAESVLIATNTQRIAEATLARSQLAAAERDLAAARSGGALLSSMQMIGGGAFIAGWKGLFSEIGAGFSRIGEEATKLSKVMGLLGASGKLAIGVIGGALSTVLRFLPYIGLIITFGPMLWNWFKDKFLPKDITEEKIKAVKKLEESTSSLFSRLDKVKASYTVEFKDKGLVSFERSLGIFINTLNDLIDTVRRANEELVKDFLAAYYELFDVTENKKKEREKKQEVKGKEPAFVQALQLGADIISNIPNISTQAGYSDIIDDIAILSDKFATLKDRAAAYRNIEQTLGDAVLASGQNALQKLDSNRNTSRRAVLDSVNEMMDAYTELGKLEELAAVSAAKAQIEAENDAYATKIKNMDDSVEYWKRKVLPAFTAKFPEFATWMNAQIADIESNLIKARKADKQASLLPAGLEQSSLQTERNKQYNQADADLDHLRILATNIQVTMAGIPDIAKLAGDAVQKLAKKESTQWTDTLTNVENLTKAIVDQEALVGKLIQQAGKDESKWDAQTAARIKGNRFILGQIKEIITREAKIAGIKIDPTKFKSYIKELDDYARSQDTIKKNFADFKASLSEITKTIPQAGMLIVEKQEQINKGAIDYLELQKRILLAIDSRGVDTGPQLKALQAEIDGISNALKIEEERLEVNYRIEQQIRDQDKAYNALNDTIQDTAEKLRKLANFRKYGTLELDVRGQLQAIEEGARIKARTLDLETAGEIAKLNFEMTIFDLTIDRLKVETALFMQQQQKDKAAIDAEMTKLDLLKEQVGISSQERRDLMNAQNAAKKANISATKAYDIATVATSETTSKAGSTSGTNFDPRALVSEALNAAERASAKQRVLQTKIEYEDPGNLSTVLEAASSKAKVSAPVEATQAANTSAGIQKELSTAVSQVATPKILLPEGTIQLTDTGLSVQQTLNTVVAKLKVPKIVLPEGTIQLTDTGTGIQNAASKIDAPKILLPEGTVQLTDTGLSVQQTLDVLAAQQNKPKILLPEGTVQLTDTGLSVQQTLDAIVANLRLPKIILPEGTVQLLDTGKGVQSAVNTATTSVEVPKILVPQGTLVYIDSAADLQKAVDNAVAQLVIPKITFPADTIEALPAMPAVTVTASKEAVPVTAPPLEAPTVPKVLSEKEQMTAEWEGKNPFDKYVIGANTAKAQMEPFMQSLRDMGPEGALPLAMSEGAIVMSDAFVNVGNVFKSTAEEVAAGNLTAADAAKQRAASVLGGVGNAIGAIGAIQAASSAQRVAAIEGEIEAEKRRDGKSKESKAKIAALEAKAEKEKKKAFERDKKMKMAQAVMNTAAAVMQALGSAPPPYSWIMAAVSVAMGAMQLAAIASTSYQGGGAIAGNTGPSAISMGERSKTVDLATSKSASGEIGYMRGESGVGGIGEFKPAFVGAKYRAQGGATTGYVVGEQGPELFVPQTPGNIVPNEELTQAPMQNVNFTIQAIDADGVQEVLTKQKGNIIRMIREAANSYGTPFLEQVNVGVYTPQAQGASKA